MGARNPGIERVRTVLASPCCRAHLRDAANGLICEVCGAEFPQCGDAPAHVFFDLMLAGGDRSAPDWAPRQHEMTGWYQNLARKDGAAACLQWDYEPLQPLLATLSGMVLDLGGGSGVARHYLPSSTEYIVIDPGVEWLQDEWQRQLASDFPCQTEPPAFVRGIGEQLPFQSGVFDAVLALWSLNHVSSAGCVVSEIARVTKPNGRAVLVLEDMEPEWRELLHPSWQVANRWSVAWQKLWSHAAGRTWPTQTDHIPIRDSELRNYLEAEFAIERRVWSRHYLTYCAAKR